MKHLHRSSAAGAKHIRFTGELVMHDYSIKLRELLRLARPRLAARHRLEFKHCFGAVAGYVDGNIFVSCGKFGVALRLPSQTLNDLFREEDVLHLKYFPNGHVKKEYAVIPNRIIEDQGSLQKTCRQQHKIRLVELVVTS